MREALRGKHTRAQTPAARQRGTSAEALQWRRRGSHPREDFRDTCFLTRSAWEGAGRGGVRQPESCVRHECLSVVPPSYHGCVSPSSVRVRAKAKVRVRERRRRASRGREGGRHPQHAGGESARVLHPRPPVRVRMQHGHDGMQIVLQQDGDLRHLTQLVQQRSRANLLEGVLRRSCEESASYQAAS